MQLIFHPYIYTVSILMTVYYSFTWHLTGFTFAYYSVKLCIMIIVSSYLLSVKLLLQLSHHIVSLHSAPFVCHSFLLFPWMFVNISPLSLFNFSTVFIILPFLPCSCPSPSPLPLLLWDVQDWDYSSAIHHVFNMLETLDFMSSSTMTKKRKSSQNPNTYSKHTHFRKIMLFHDPAKNNIVCFRIYDMDCNIDNAKYVMTSPS